ncbi:hypothetical protein DERP_003296 [Dermatophagoides pteronyssinus]|uniref:Uncharacterized protein n=1 Tax=Dermatophagoides pteronyssinus TaxID=6956 RepID=A0ABQ8JJ48_DERPT|nr:hypothetical protein DERP_003296 [Dermatophagoides pteronyssinus]
MTLGVLKFQQHSLFYQGKDLEMARKANIKSENMATNLWIPKLGRKQNKTIKSNHSKTTNLFPIQSFHQATNGNNLNKKT